MTLYTSLVTVSKAAAPMIPFMTEDIYQNLVRSVDKSAPESIHLCDFPSVDQVYIDKELESGMKELLEIVVLGRAARNGANIKNRQPLSVMYVKTERPLDSMYVDIIEDELNIKKVEFTDNADDFVSYKFKPQLKTVGPKYGKQLGEIRGVLSALDGSAAKAELDEKGSIILKLSQGDVVLETADLLIETEQRDGYFTLSDKGVTVALSTILSPELIDEGFARELVSKIQTMRKEANFNVTDHINITMSGSDKVTEVARRMKESISGDTLADSLVCAEPCGYVKSWNINGEHVSIGLEKA